MLVPRSVSRRRAGGVGVQAQSSDLLSRRGKSPFLLSQRKEPRFVGQECEGRREMLALLQSRPFQTSEPLIIVLMLMKAVSCQHMACPSRSWVAVFQGSARFMGLWNTSWRAACGLNPVHRYALGLGMLTQIKLVFTEISGFGILLNIQNNWQIGLTFQNCDNCLQLTHAVLGPPYDNKLPQVCWLKTLASLSCSCAGQKSEMRLVLKFWLVESPHSSGEILISCLSQVLGVT